MGPEGTYSEKAALLWIKDRPEAAIVYFNDFEGVRMNTVDGNVDVQVFCVVVQPPDCLVTFQAAMLGKNMYGFAHLVNTRALFWSPAQNPMVDGVFAAHGVLCQRGHFCNVAFMGVGQKVLCFVVDALF